MEKEAWVTKAEADKARYLQVSDYIYTTFLLQYLKCSYGWYDCRTIVEIPTVDLIISSIAHIIILIIQELSQYTPPVGFDAKGDALQSQQEVKGRKGKQPRDVNAPKRNLSAYLLYQNTMRDQFKQENRKLQCNDCF